MGRAPKRKKAMLQGIILPEHSLGTSNLDDAKDANNFYKQLTDKIDNCAGVSKSKKKREYGECIESKCVDYDHEREKNCDGKKIGLYLKTVAPGWEGMTKNRLYKHIQNMLENAEGIRRFEIELIWRRAIYFIPLIAVFFTAFGGAFLNLENGNIFSIPGVILLLPIATVNTCLCFFLSVINSESQKWQNNWENHVDYLQEILGVTLMRTCLRHQARYFSIGKINALMSVFMFTVWQTLVVLLALLYIFENNLDYGWEYDLSSNFLLIMIVGGIVLMYITFYNHKLITGKSFFDAREVIGNSKFYKRRLGDFDWDNLENKRLTLVEKIVRSFFSLILIYAFLVTTFYFNGKLIQEKEEYNSIIFIAFVEFTVLYFILEHRILFKAWKIKDREKGLWGICKAAVPIRKREEYMYFIADFLTFQIATATAMAWILNSYYTELLSQIYKYAGAGYLEMIVGGIVSLTIIGVAKLKNK